MSKQFRWEAAIGAAILALGVVGFAALTWARPEPESEDTKGPGVEVAVAEVRSAASSRPPVEADGIVEPRVRVALAAQVAGEVRDVHPAFVSGGRVDEGERLVRLDARDAVNRVRQVQATVAQREVDARLAAGEAQVARTTADRLSGEGLDVPGPDDPTGDLVARLPQKKAAAAALDAARAQLDDAELALQRTTIEAPLDAVVEQVEVGVGSYVAPGRRLGILLPADVVEIEVSLSGAEARQVPDLYAVRPAEEKPRVTATVHRPGDARTWPGTLHRTELVVDPTARTVTAVVRVRDPFDGEHPLLVGQIVTVRFEGRPLEDGATTFVVPSQAVRWASGSRVWAVEPGGADAPEGASVLRAVDVEVLHEGPDEAWIRTDALTEDDRVVTSPLDVPEDGQIVRIAARGAG